jgi:hypothetical protein
MKKIIILSVLMLPAFISIQAQDTVRHISPCTGPIRKIPIEMAHDNNAGFYTIDGKPADYNELKACVLNYHPSALEYNQSIVNRNVTWCLFGGFCAASFMAIAQYGHENGKLDTYTLSGNGTIITTHANKNFTTAHIFTGVAVGLLAATIVSFVNTAKHARRTIEKYNAQFP